MKIKNHTASLMKENNTLKRFVFLFSFLTVMLSIWSMSLITDNNKIDSSVKVCSKINAVIKAENIRILKIREIEHEKTKNLLSSLKGQLNIIDAKLKFYSSSSKIYNKEQLEFKK